MQGLRHLALAMPQAGIAPLATLRRLTYLRLLPRHRREPPPLTAFPAPAVMTASFGVLCGHYALQRVCWAARERAQVRGPCAAPSGAAVALRNAASAAHTMAVSIALATAPVAAAVGVRLLHAQVRKARWVKGTGIIDRIGPEPQTAQRQTLLPISRLTSLEWLDLRSCDENSASEWALLLGPLRRLRRLDVRDTNFKDGTALQGKPKLRALLVAGSRVSSTKLLREQGQLPADASVR